MANVEGDIRVRLTWQGGGTAEGVYVNVYCKADALVAVSSGATSMRTATASNGLGDPQEVPTDTSSSYSVRSEGTHVRYVPASGNVAEFSISPFGNSLATFTSGRPTVAASIQFSVSLNTRGVTIDHDPDPTYSKASNGNVMQTPDDDLELRRMVIGIDPLGPR